MARPRKKEEEKRERRFNLRFTPAEFSHVCLQAQRAGLAPHDYMRRRILGHVVVIANLKRSDPALVSELNRIGVNLNQLARAVNMDRDFTDCWGELSLELRRVLALMMAEDHGSEAP